MRKPEQQIELLPSNPSKEELALDRLAEAVLQRIAAKENIAVEKADTEDELQEVLMHPWCLPRDIANAIRRLIPVWHWKKYGWVYADNGCFKCERKDVPHQSLGMCNACFSQYFNRVKASIVKHAGGDRPNVKEMKAALTIKSDSARNILAEIVGSSEAPASKPPALPGSTAFTRYRGRSR